MNPSVLLALANIRRRRRSEAAPREPFVSVGEAIHALAQEGVAIGRLTATDLPVLDRLTESVSELADCLALGHPPARRAVQVINRLASSSTARMQVLLAGNRVQTYMDWSDPDPVARLARLVVEELNLVDPNRLRQCDRKECDLLFLDVTRSRSQRWHAESPCGWLERQHRRRTT